MRPWIPATAAVLLSMLGIAGCELVGTNMSTTFTEVADRLEAEERERAAAAQEPTGEPAADEDSAAPHAEKGAEEGAEEGAADQAAPTEADPTQAAPTEADSPIEEPPAPAAPEPTAAESAPAPAATGATSDLAARCASLSEPACRAHRACGWSGDRCIPAPPKVR